MRTPLRLALLLALILAALPLAPSARAADVVNRISLVSDSYVVGSEGAVLAILNFTTGTPPNPSLVDNVNFTWYSPNGTLAFMESVDPDEFGFVVSRHALAVEGTWWVNATYSTNVTVYSNLSVEVLPSLWSSGTHVRIGNVEVGTAANLTLAPGAIVRFEPGGGLTVRGRLLAQGTAVAPILLTSNLSSPSRGDWDGLRLTVNATPDSILENLTVEYAATGLALESASINVTSSLFRENLYGVRVSAAAVTIEGTTFENNTIGLEVLSSAVDVVRSDFTANAIGVRIAGISQAAIREVTVASSTTAGIQSEGETALSLADLALQDNADHIRLLSGTAVAADIVLTGGDRGITASADATLTIRDSAVQDPAILAFLVRENASVTAESVLLVPADPLRISVEGAGGATLTLRNLLSIQAVSFENGSGLSGVSVVIHDGAAVASSLVTNATGHTLPFLVTDRVYDPLPRRNETRVELALAGLSFENNNISAGDLSTPRSLLFRGSSADLDGDARPDFADLDDDADDLLDTAEVTIGTDPRDPDSDDDGAPDGWEHVNQLNPLNATDLQEDADLDVLTNAAEFALGTDPRDRDTDGDGMPDGWEAHYLLDALDAADAATDPDGDTFTNLQEFQGRSNPADGASQPGSPVAHGTIQGRVYDGDGVPVGGVTVALASGASAVTDAQGNFTIADILAGFHTITASRTGYSTESFDEVLVVDGETTVVTFALNVTGDGGEEPKSESIPLAYIVLLAVAAFIAVAVIVTVSRQRRHEQLDRERIRALRKTKVEPDEKQPEMRDPPS